MFDFFDTIIEYISLVFDWFVGFLSASFTFMKAVHNSIDVPTSLIGFMPSVIGSCIGAVVAVAVVKAIFGR